MADHGNNYIRSVSPDGDGEIGMLGEDCGHHCGVVTVGGNQQKIGHCNCEECHG